MGKCSGNIFSSALRWMCNSTRTRFGWCSKKRCRCLSFWRFDRVNRLARSDIPRIIEVMSTVAEIKKALQTIPLDDARKVADWLQHYLDEKWDTQIDADIEAGRLDKLADKAIEDYRAGRVKQLDEVIDQP